MINLTINERKVMQLILHSSGLKLGAFTIFKKLKIDMPSFISTLSSLDKQGFISYTSTEIELLEAGREYIMLANLDASASKNVWGGVPEKYVGKKIDVDELYIPSKKLLSKKTFNINKD